MTETSTLEKRHAEPRDRRQSNSKEQHPSTKGVKVTEKLNGWLQSRELQPPK